MGLQAFEQNQNSGDSGHFVMRITMFLIFPQQSTTLHFIHSPSINMTFDTIIIALIRFVDTTVSLLLHLFV